MIDIKQTGGGRARYGNSGTHGQRVPATMHYHQSYYGAWRQCPVRSIRLRCYSHEIMVRSNPSKPRIAAAYTPGRWRARGPATLSTVMEVASPLGRHRSGRRRSSTAEKQREAFRH